jgi:hypothetical protein
LPAGRKAPAKITSLQDPERVAPSLAQVIKVEGGIEAILGQAWLAAPNLLVTCAHVVEESCSNPQSISIRFPSSGNRYPVTRIKLHPSFVRQPDGLVKFDLAVLSVQLAYPETEAQAMPFVYERPLKAHEGIFAIRYPAHLGQLSVALQPLRQDGRFLGLLRKHDSFHLLHDLPLAAGDSGTPLCDNRGVVAIHCGDTATIPGLNLPATSIRLALWIDALRDLGLPQVSSAFGSGASSPWALTGLAFLGATVAAAALTLLLVLAPASKTWETSKPVVAPIEIGFNEPAHAYKRGEDIMVSLTPKSNCHLYLFNVQNNTVALLYPSWGLPPLVRSGDTVRISQFGHTKLTATPEPAVWQLVAIDCQDKARADALGSQLLQESDYALTDRADRPLRLKGTDLDARIESIRQQGGDYVLHTIIQAPTSK